MPGIGPRLIGMALLAAALGLSAAVGQEEIPPPLLPAPAAPQASPPAQAAPLVAPPAPAAFTPPPEALAPSPPMHVHQQGPIVRAIDHASYTIHDRMVGEPWRFNVPPLGLSSNTNFAAQAAGAEPHRYTLYRSDFYAGTEHLTPNGQRRLGRMFRRPDCWPGPVLVEPDPGRPGLAEARREAVLGILAGGGVLVDPNRVVIAPSPYLGERGDIGALNNQIMLDRSLAAPEAFSLPPLPTADFGN